MKTLEAGASTTVWAAVSEDCVISKEVDSVEEIYKNMFGYMPYATNQEGVDKLWEISEKIVNNN